MKNKLSTKDHLQNQLMITNSLIDQTRMELYSEYSKIFADGFGHHLEPSLSLCNLLEKYNLDVNEDEFKEYVYLWSNLTNLELYLVKLITDYNDILNKISIRENEKTL